MYSFCRSRLYLCDNFHLPDAILVGSVFIPIIFHTHHTAISVSFKITSSIAGVQCHSVHGCCIAYPAFFECEDIQRYQYGFEWSDGFQQ